MFNRRVFFGGAAAAAVLASSALTAGTALAGTTPQLTNDPAASVLQAGPAMGLPGITGILQSVPSSNLMSPAKTSSSAGNQVTKATHLPKTVSGMKSGVNSARSRQATKPAGALSGATSGTSGLSGLKAAGVPNQATSIIPALGGVTASTPQTGGISAPIGAAPAAPVRSPAHIGS